MSETKTYVFGNDGNNGYQNGFDPNFLIGAMMGGGGGFGGFGGANWLLPFLLFALWGGNGWGGFGGGFGNRGIGGCCNAAGFGFLSDQLNNDAGRELIMQAIQGNNTAIGQLATTLNCNVGELRTALDSISTQICNLGNQVGMSSMQVINAITSGNSTLQAQLAQCCCDLKGAVAESNYLTERGFCNTNQILTKGFSDLGYASAQQTCELKGVIKDSTDRIIDGQRAAEMRALTDKIDALRERNSTLTTQLNLEHQNQYTAGVVAQSIAPVNAALGDLSSRLAKIECKQPETVTIPYIPAMGNYIPVNYSVPIHFGANTYNNCGYC